MKKTIQLIACVMTFMTFPMHYAKSQTCDEITQSQIITSDEAVQYILNFWKDPKCIAFGEKYGAGNFIPYLGEDGLKNTYPKTTFGIAIYPCLYKKWFSTGLYMSMKPTTVCPGIQNTVPILDTDEFYQSNWKLGEFTTASRVDNLSMRRALENLNVEATKIPSKLFGGQVRRANDRYKTDFGNDQPYVNSGFGFTKMESLITLLTPQSGVELKGFYIIFGLDSTLAQDRIRLILVAVDTNGNLLLGPNDNCLEKSWPPITPLRNN